MTREYIKKLMHECIETDVEDSFISLNELHKMVDQFYETYNDWIIYDSDNSSGYYMFVDNYSLGHPAHILLTVMTLLFAGVKKIWLECYQSYEDKELFEIHHKLTKHLLDEVINRFPQIILLENIPYEKVQTFGIDFVNQNRNIDHVVLLGGYNGTYWKIARYRKDVAIHLPTAVAVWVDYSSREELYRDDSFIKFGRYGWNELYDYKCCYCKRMKELDSVELFVGLGYNNFWDWKEFVLIYDEERNSRKNIVDVTPIYLFGSEKNIKECLGTMSVYLKPVTSKDFCVDKIEYHFLNLLKKNKNR